jgi:DNA-binding YbaB/EbfC family protein
MFDQLKQAREMQKLMQQMKDEMGKMRITSEAGGGAVVVVGNGNRDIVDVKLDKEALKDCDLEMLENFLKAALKDLSKKTEKEIKSRMKNNLGPLSNMMGI